MKQKDNLIQIFVVALLIIFLIASIATWWQARCPKFNAEGNLLTEVTQYTFTFIGTIVAGFYGVSLGAKKSFHEVFGNVMPHSDGINKEIVSKIYVYAYLAVGVLYLVGLVINKDSDFYSKIVMSFLGLVTALVSVYFKPE